EVVRVRRGVRAAEQLALWHGDQVDCEADLPGLLLDALQDRGAVRVDDRAGPVRQLHGEGPAALRADAVGVPSGPAGRIQQLVRLRGVVAVLVRGGLAVAGRGPAHA